MSKCKCKPDVIYRAGDTPTFAGKVTDTNGAFDLTGYSIKLFIVRNEYYTDVVEKDAVIDADPTTGIWSVTLDSTDLICGECQELVFKLISPTAAVVSLETKLLTVLRDPANP